MPLWRWTPLWCLVLREPPGQAPNLCNEGWAGVRRACASLDDVPEPSVKPATRVVGRDIWLVLASICSVQFGAASAKSIFGLVPATTTVWLRLAAASVLMLVMTAVVRGRRRTPAELVEASPSTSSGTTNTRNWTDGLLYSALLVTMNWTFYQALARIPVGIGVTIEFLGPLAVAVVGARRARDFLWPVLALAGVAMLGFTPTRLDPIGVMFALVAAACWAGYIVFGARAGRTWPGTEAITLGCTIGALVLAWPAIHGGGPNLWTPHVLFIGGLVGLLSSVIPYSLEMHALRTIPPRVFGILMSVEPAVAAVFAWLLLREGLHLTDLVAMACVIIATVGATRQT